MRSHQVTPVLSLLIGLTACVMPQRAAAQEAKPMLLSASGCVVVASVHENTPRRRVLVNGEHVAADISDRDQSGVVVAVLKEPLQLGQHVVFEYGGVGSDALSVAIDTLIGCVQQSRAPFSDDDREAFETPFAVGAAFEQFAPGFYNPDTETQASRAVFQVEALYRLFRAHPGRFPFQVWLYGGFHAGLRSYCATDNPSAGGGNQVSQVVCTPFSVNNINESGFILRNATSFEEFEGVRFEFLALNMDPTSDDSKSEFAGNVFVTARDLRFALDRATANKLSDPLVGVGFIIKNGALRGTIFQTGIGSSPLYAPDPVHPKWNRWKAEFTLFVGASKTVKDRLTFWDKTKDGLRYYFALRSDFDNGPEADSVRVSTGISFNPSAFFSAGGAK